MSQSHSLSKTPLPSVRSIESAEAGCSTSDSLPFIKDKRERELKVALLKSTVADWETKILSLRNELCGKTGDSLQHSKQVLFYKKRFSDFKTQIRSFRNSLAAHYSLVHARCVRLSEETQRKEEQIAELDKRLLFVSLEFSNAKKEHAQRKKKGLFSKLFG